MTLTVAIPASLRRLTGGASSVQASGKTIGELFTDIDRQHPGFKSQLCDDTGAIRRFAAIFVDGKDIRTLKGTATPLTGSETVTIMAALAGG
jgi:sulfur-carrier protein